MLRTERPSIFQFAASCKLQPSSGDSDNVPLHSTATAAWFLLLTLLLCSFAASQGFQEIVQLLIDRGAAVNAAAADKTLPLHAAAFRGHQAVVQLLLDRGAAVDGVPALPMQFTTVTPLHHAASQGHVGVAQLLLDRGAAVNGWPADCSGHTPLHAAAFAGHQHMVQLLIDWGAEVNAVAADHSTPLYLAASQGHAGVVQQLLLLGAEPEAATTHGNTPLLAAAAAGKQEAVEVLIGHLATSRVLGHAGISQHLTSAAAAAHKNCHGSTFAVIARELGRHSPEELTDLYKELGMPADLASSMLAVVLGWCKHTDTLQQQEAEIRRKQQKVTVQLKSVQQMLVQSALNMRAAQQMQQQAEKVQQHHATGVAAASQPAATAQDPSACPSAAISILGPSGGVKYRLLVSICVFTLLLLGVVAHV